MLKIGFLVNPFAGMGGSVALKGSDAVVEEAFRRGAVQTAPERAKTFLLHLSKRARENIRFFTASGEMGQSVLLNQSLTPEGVVDVSNPSTAKDTCSAAKALSNQVDLLVFVGGDGTARDVFSSVHATTLCLGVPAGVKMHSGVFAVNPQSAAEVVNRMAANQVLRKTERLVKDIDEEAFRAGRVEAKTYGSLWVPDAINFLQYDKSGSKENEALAQLDIAQYISGLMDPQITYYLGSGSTTYALKKELGLDGTLLGVDVVKGGELLVKDATGQQLLEHFKPGETVGILSVIGGQGHLFGRGNQQFSADLIRKLGLDHVWVIATQAKMRDLDGRPLRLDTGDAKLDLELSGIVEITVGYDQRVLKALAG